MPYYDYYCKKCRSHKTVFHKMAEKPDVKCDKCNKYMCKLISTAGIVYKCGGFYCTQGRETRKDNES